MPQQNYLTKSVGIIEKVFVSPDAGFTEVMKVETELPESLDVPTVWPGE